MDNSRKKEFEKKCELHLPINIRVDGIEYRLAANTLFGGGFQLSYGKFDGIFFDWSIKLIDRVYCKEEGPDYGIADFLKRLNEYTYEKLEEIVSKQDRFRRELTSLINRYSKESGSNTPDYVLANYLIIQILVFDNAVNSREKHYGRESKQIEKEEISEM